MPADAALKLESDIHDRLLRWSLPALVQEHVGDEQASSLRRLLEDVGAGEDELIEELDNCWAAGSDVAAMLDPQRADQAERVGVLARHLAQHLAFADAAPAAASRHLQRATHIASELGRGPGPMGVVN